MKKALTQSLRTTLALMILPLLAIGIYLILGMIPTKEPQTGGPQAPGAVQQSIPLTRDSLLKLINQERAKVGAPALIIDETLNKSAQWKADDMQNLNYEGHQRPGETVDNGVAYAIEAMNETDIFCKYISENLAWDESRTELTADEAITWWKGSPSHYRAMIDPKYTYTGFGTTHSFVAQHFCET